jgi:hypothetical protein
MDEATRGVFESIYDVLDGAGVLIQLGVITAALVRFRATAAGILAGNGLSAILLVSVVAGIGQPAMRRAGVSRDTIVALSGARSDLQTLLTVTVPVAVGSALIPASPEKLSGRT